MKKLALELFLFISKKQSDFILEKVIFYVLKSAGDRFFVTLLKLAYDIPKYSVSRKDKICVEKYGALFTRLQ